MGAASEVDFALSDLVANFLGFLFSPLVDAGDLFSLFSADVAEFDAASLLADCGFEASFGGDFFGCSTLVAAESFDLGVVPVGGDDCLDCTD